MRIPAFTNWMILLTLKTVSIGWALNLSLALDSLYLADCLPVLESLRLVGVSVGVELSFGPSSLLSFMEGLFWSYLISFSPTLLS